MEKTCASLGAEFLRFQSAKSLKYRVEIKKESHDDDGDDKYYNNIIIKLVMAY